MATSTLTSRRTSPRWIPRPTTAAISARPGLHDGCAERVAQRRIERDVRQQCSNDGTERATSQPVDRVVHRRPQFVAGVAGVVDRDVGRRKFEQQLEGELLLRCPSSIDGRLADAGPRCDVFEPKVREAVFDDQVARCIEDGPVRLVASRTATAHGLRLAVS